MRTRPIDRRDIAHVVELWHAGWHDAHGLIVSAELCRRRTLASFRDRLERMIPDIYVISEARRPLGFYALKGDEIHQFFVAAASRGSGVAAVLMADAEARLVGRRVRRAWLGCAIGNDRAARFYEKCGWQRTDSLVTYADVDGATFAIDIWRYDKTLPPSA